MLVDKKAKGTTKRLSKKILTILVANTLVQEKLVIAELVFEREDILKIKFFFSLIIVDDLEVSEIKEQI